MTNNVEPNHFVLNTLLREQASELKHVNHYAAYLPILTIAYASGHVYSEYEFSRS